MGAQLDWELVKGFATALLVGALVGLEREKHRQADQNSESPGLRTLIIVAEIGAVAGWLTQLLSSPWPLAAVVLAVAAAVVGAYVTTARVQPEALGMTTEFATLAVCLLGAVATLGHVSLAAGLGVVTAAVLAYKQSLHALVAKLGWDDVYAGLRLLVAAFIVLPLLPDRPIDPLGALNPASLWRLVLLISSLSLVGYVATRWLGPGRGIALTGITGGLVSSTAVTLSFARDSTSATSGASARCDALAGGVLLAWSIMFVRVIAEVLIVNPAIVTRVVLPFAAMALAASAAAGWLLRAAGHRDASRANEVPLTNPFSLTAAARVAAFFAIVLVFVKVAQRQFPGTGVYVVSGIAGLTDVDAITLSMAEQARSGDVRQAVLAIVIASVANTIVKAALVVAVGHPGLRRRIVPATLAVLAIGGAVALF